MSLETRARTRGELRRRPALGLYALLIVIAALAVLAALTSHGAPRRALRDLSDSAPLLQTRDAIAPLDLGPAAGIAGPRWLDAAQLMQGG
jgi:hypothetical protein